MSLPLAQLTYIFHYLPAEGRPAFGFDTYQFEMMRLVCKAWNTAMDVGGDLNQWHHHPYVTLFKRQFSSTLPDLNVGSFRSFYQMSRNFFTEQPTVHDKIALAAYKGYDIQLKILLKHAEKEVVNQPTLCFVDTDLFFSSTTKLAQLLEITTPYGVDNAIGISYYTSTPLQNAIRGGHLSTVNELLDYPEINLTEGCSYLEYALIHCLFIDGACFEKEQKWYKKSYDTAIVERLLACPEMHYDNQLIDRVFFRPPLGDFGEFRIEHFARLLPLLKTNFVEFDANKWLIKTFELFETEGAKFLQDIPFETLVPLFQLPYVNKMACNEKGDTFLHFACRQLCLPVIKALISIDNLFTPNRAGLDPLDLLVDHTSIQKIIFTDFFGALEFKIRIVEEPSRLNEFIEKILNSEFRQ